MLIKLYTVTGHADLEGLFYTFSINGNDQLIVSPMFTTEQVAVEAMKNKILWLRTLENEQQKECIQQNENEYHLSIFKEAIPDVQPSSFFTNSVDAVNFLASLQSASHADIFDITHYNFIHTKTDETPIIDLSLTDHWSLEKTSVLDLSKPKSTAKFAKIATSIPAAAMLASQPCAPLFNLLRPYKKAEINRFFGREKETEELYEKTFDSRLLIVHGERSTGKTSLVQCGLANRLKTGKWREIYVKRWLNINKATRKRVVESAQNLGLKEDLKEADTMDILRSSYQQTFQPVLLVFDQLENLFKLPYSAAEQKEFFTFIQALIQDTSFPAKIILIIRDDYLAHLSDFETLVPTLLDHRYHLKHLSSTAAKMMINGLLGQLVASGKINVDNPDLVAQKIQENLTGNKESTRLACSQIYLHQIHQYTCGSVTDGLVVFDSKLIDDVGEPKKLIRSYLDDRINQLEKTLPKDQGPILELEQAKEIEDLVELQNSCGCSEAPTRSTWLAKWFERGQRNRQLIWFLRLCLLAFLLSALALGLAYCSLSRQQPCVLAQESEDCATKIDYLCHQQVDENCANSLKEILDNENCPIWLDYKSALKEDNCKSYWTFVKKHQNDGVCLDRFYQILAERACPMGIDTVTTIVFDTIVKEIPVSPTPTGYNKIPEGSKARCQEKFGFSTIKLGPLFMMTSDLNNGTRYDWIGALAACKNLGPNWRLPCAGEIDFIIDKHYQDESAAYDNLTSGDCPVFPISNSSVSGNFWTATEANDNNAWSIHFDTKDEDLRMIYNTDKTTSMPCRCVYRDPNISSGIPDCFEKAVYRPGQ